jgi:hypothetical protein
MPRDAECGSKVPEKGRHLLRDRRPEIRVGAAMSIVVELEDDALERSEWVLLHGVVPAREDRAASIPSARLSSITWRGRTLSKSGSAFATVAATIRSATPGSRSKIRP